MSITTKKKWTAAKGPPKDPPMRKDKLCVVDSKPLPQIAVVNGDPFCSTACCRKWFELSESGVSVNRLTA